MPPWSPLNLRNMRCRKLADRSTPVATRSLPAAATVPSTTLHRYWPTRRSAGNSASRHRERVSHTTSVSLFRVVAAAKASLLATPRRIALGHVNYSDLQGNPGTRFFVVTAGVGVDAHLFYKLHAGTKQHMGMAAYYAKAWSIWFSYPMTRFVAEYRNDGSGARRQVEVTELMAVRIRNFGGVLQELAPGASLDRDDMRLVFCRTASRLAYLAYVTRGLLRRRWTIPGIDLAHSTSVSCSYRVARNRSPRGSARSMSKPTANSLARSRSKSELCRMP